jgi:tRNA/tmRNA/rRNA uracil-C5-methylase (TrmA/RlmC/RlmD family)
LNKLEITINRADELIAAMTRLADVLENKKGEQSSSKEIKYTPITKEVTMVQIRAVLTTKQSEGKKLQIKELLQQYGSASLKNVDPAKYPDLLKDAESL